MLANSIKKVAAVLAIASAASLVPLSSASASTETPAWRTWAANGEASFDALAHQYTVLILTLNVASSSAKNNAEESDLAAISSDAVAIAGFDNSPSEAMNHVIVKLARVSNSMAWKGYMYLATGSVSDSLLAQFKADLSAATADFKEVAALIKKNA